MTERSKYDLKPITTEVYCEICGETKEPHLHTINEITPRPLLCTRCGKRNTPSHICVPLALQCATCNKPTVEIEHCTGHIIVPEPICAVCGRPRRLCTCVKCPSCNNLMSLTKCDRCGKKYYVCTNCCLATTHICILPPPPPPKYKCPRCGRMIPMGTICRCMLIIPRVIAEKELSKYLAEGWTFKTQLQSGDVLMEKEIDVETITGNILEQAQKQITEEKSKTDVEKITEQVMEQANKQIAEAIEKEKQKLLS